MEKQLGESLPVFSKMASDGELRKLICLHIARTLDHKARLLAVFSRHRIRLGSEVSDALRDSISGSNMEFSKLRDASIRDLLVTAHCKRIGENVIENYCAAACIARTEGYRAEWELLTAFYAEQEDTLSHLAAIGARLLEQQARRSHDFQMAC